MKKWLIIFGCWSIPIVFVATHSYLYATARGLNINWGATMLWAMSEWYTWAALSPLILWLAHKYPIERPRLGSALAIHLAAGVFFAITQSVLLTAIRYYGSTNDPISLQHLGQSLTQPIAVRFHVNFATYVVVVSCSHALEYYRRYRDREKRSAQLEATLAHAELQALRMQIHPHFLFNSLNSISALIDDDPKAAHRMLARLGDFLRLTLKTSGNQTSSLEQELQFLKSYLEIEQVRFGDRLKVNIDVEPAAMPATVPSLILQPIVENAFRHGISKVEVGTLDIQGRRRGDALELVVRDNGPGMSASANMGEGVGLANTRARLKTQYGDSQSLVMENARDGGVAVTIKIPFQNGASKWN